MSYLCEEKNKLILKRFLTLGKLGKTLLKNGTSVENTHVLCTFKGTPNLEPRVSLLPFRRSKRGKKTDRSHYAENGAFRKRSSNATITGSRKT